METAKAEATIPTITVALFGDVMLAGRVGERVASGEDVFAPGVRALLIEADLVIANLECCLTQSADAWPSPGKRFYFRAPQASARVLADVGVGVVTLANNHTLDYGHRGLADTIAALRDAGIEPVGAGADLRRAQAPAVVAVSGRTVGVIGVTDHPADFAAGPDRPGVDTGSFFTRRRQRVSGFDDHRPRWWCTVL